MREDYVSRKFNTAGKRIGVILSGAVLVCLLAACSLSGEGAAAGGGESDDSFGEGEVQTPLTPAESFKAVLLDDKDFICTDLQNERLKLKDIKEAVTDEEDVTIAAAEFSVIDLDDDGLQEIVLWLKINGVSDYGSAVLRYQEGDVYEYTLPYRSFMELKGDGTFLFSSGAADSGIGKLNFSEEEYTIDALYYSKSEFDFDQGCLQYKFFLKGALCAEDKFIDGMSRQEEKTAAVWHDLTADNVNSVLGEILCNTP